MNKAPTVTPQTQAGGPQAAASDHPSRRWRASATRGPIPPAAAMATALSSLTARFMSAPARRLLLLRRRPVRRSRERAYLFRPFFPAFAMATRLTALHARVTSAATTCTFCFSVPQWARSTSGPMLSAEKIDGERAPSSSIARFMSAAVPRRRAPSARPCRRAAWSRAPRSARNQRLPSPPLRSLRRSPHLLIPSGRDDPPPWLRVLLIPQEARGTRWMESRRKPKRRDSYTYPGEGTQGCTAAGLATAVSLVTKHACGSSSWIQ